MKHKYGYRPDLNDHRDYKFSLPHKQLKVAPPLADLRSTMPKIWDQGNLGSCTANATCAQVWYADRTNPYEPSRLAVYYFTRMLEKTTKYDSGASIRDSIKSVVIYGFPAEPDWPYIIARYKVRPPKKVFDNAFKERAIQYERVPQIPDYLKSAVAVGYSVNFGFTVFNSFESASVAKTGIMKMPSPGEAVLGGHAVLIVGYNDDRQVYIVRNSWSDQWGDKGYFYMPYSFMHNPKYCSDFWIVKTVM